jgi:transaldolase/glucose-6-phosphate isomerase
MNPLKRLNEMGQSVWLDYIRRGLLSSGELMRYVKEDGVRGVTSNPAIFGKAISGSTDYTELLEELEREGLDPTEIYERISQRDIQDAADILKQVYEETEGYDGFVSLEVSPYLAHDTEETVKEARRLWESVGRKNLMIKVPATPEGIPAIERLIGEGINVNVTLIFSIDVYVEVALAYMRGVQRLQRDGKNPSGVSSVASFFVSRIDSAVDMQLDAQRKEARTGEEKAFLGTLKGKAAIASAKLAYRKYKELYRDDAWNSLARRGAKTQRLLWASTGTKNPEYSDVRYVEELIGPDTVNTMPPSTLDAFRDHGRVRQTIDENIEEARKVIEELSKTNISMKSVTDALLKKGVALFSEAFDALLRAIDRNCADQLKSKSHQMRYSLPKNIEKKVTETLESWQAQGKVRRLWERDSTIWTNSEEGKWLGWLDIVEKQIAHSEPLLEIAEEVNNEEFTHALLLGMGGSSLCPELLSLTFGHRADFPRLFVLDSTDPAQIQSFEEKVDLSHTAFIVSSKSGSTLEPNIFMQYFMQRLKEAGGIDDVGGRFIAITDPGSKLEQFANKEQFRYIFHGVPSIGGRYSALSNFGMVPAAVMGIDTLKLLDRAEEMRVACSPCVRSEDNPAVVLGVILGVLEKSGRNKITITTSPGIYDFGAWLEQLLAESTGKIGRGLIPVDREQLGPPSVYGKDRVFVYVRLSSFADPVQDRAMRVLEEAGEPVVRIDIEDMYDLGQEFFRWEMATAVAGSIIGINPFDQPDVEASKVVTRELTAEYEKTGSFPHEPPVYEERGLKIYTDRENAGWLKNASNNFETLEKIIEAHLNRFGAGDYFALLAYLEMNKTHEDLLQSIRHTVRDTKRVATCLGFGPRFLHSTGQVYKGGPNSGVFVQITCDDRKDLQIPEKRYSFGVVKAAQAMGDLEVLARRKRRLLRVHLKGDCVSGLRRLKNAVDAAVR